ncbi:hypothetical protein ACIPV9_05425 [Pseudomonas psychrophila]|uniref:hypothetical protein n=1 Tax=Pseudomonas psychrophila TaxID=122355 RepID=UPI003828C6BC
MRDNDKWESLHENWNNVANEKLRRRKLEELKKASLASRRIYSTLLLLLVCIVFSLVADNAPVSDLFKESVVKSWQTVTVFVIVFILALYRIWSDGFSSESISFIEFDERNRLEKQRYSSNFDSSGANKGVSENPSSVGGVKDEQAKIVKSRKAVSGYDFVEHMRSIIESLDYQIDYSEEKASVLLETGRNFVRGGIWLYVSNIIIWQAYLYYIDFALSPGVIVGMVSSTMIFLIMEFLGAWYLKQYRHYGDSAFSYMKVRSSYNKYMLAYCAIYEFTTEDLSGAKEDMLRVLAESEKWPDVKDVNANDFNYMLQSVDSMGAVFEKLKGVFGRNNGTGSPP